MRPADGESPRARDLYILAAMLTAAAAGRLLDALGLLPGVHESAVVRGAGVGWLTALIGAGLVASAAARRWSRTSSPASTAAVVVPGQLLVFFGAEAVVRLANGQPPLDPDALVGALLQAALAVALLAALTALADVALQLRPPRLGGLPSLARASLTPPSQLVGHLQRALVEARAPPRAV